MWECRVSTDAGGGKPCFATSVTDIKFQTNLVTETQACICCYFICEPLRIRLTYMLTPKEKATETLKRTRTAKTFEVTWRRQNPMSKRAWKYLVAKFSDMELTSHDYGI